MHVSEAPKTLEIAHPNCPKCGARMWIARIELVRLEHDRGTFECIECDHSITEIVKYK
jgi:hypothetical protein